METIIAQSTPNGISGLAILRISGPNCKKILRIFCKKQKLCSRKMSLNYFYDKKSQILDQVMIVFYKSPQSFTGEDMLEIFPHGSPVILEKILAELLNLEKNRIAMPGEFSKRAILNKKLTLIDAENLNNLIHAETEFERRLIAWQSFGGLKKKLTYWKEELIKIIAHCDATIEFDTEDEKIANIDFQKNISVLQSTVDKTLSRSILAKKIIEGQKIVICGPPNVGKSTIFNLINQDDRSIVSNYTGTTRDIISTPIMLKNKKLCIFDTAGLRETSNEIEQIGIKKAKDLLDSVQNMILVLSSDVVKNKYVKQVRDFLNQQKGKKILVLFNKWDLDKKVRETLQEQVPQLKKLPSITTYCAQDANNNKMYEMVVKFISNNLLEKPEKNINSDAFVEKRHFEHLKKIKNHLILASRREVGIEIAAEELRLALLELESITGNVENERKFDYIFKSFCIGK